MHTMPVDWFRPPPRGSGRWYANGEQPGYIRAKDRFVSRVEYKMLCFFDVSRFVFCEFMESQMKRITKDPPRVFL